MTDIIIILIPSYIKADKPFTTCFSQVFETPPNVGASPPSGPPIAFITDGSES